jgi:hypothetical protein
MESSLAKELANILLVAAARRRKSGQIFEPFSGQVARAGASGREAMRWRYRGFQWAGMRRSADKASAHIFREGAGHASPSDERHVGFAGLTLAVCEPVMSSVAIDTDKFHSVPTSFSKTLVIRFSPASSLRIAQMTLRIMNPFRYG